MEPLEYYDGYKDLYVKEFRKLLMIKIGSSCLTEREIFILFSYFFSKNKTTYRAIGEKLGISAARVQALIRKSIRKIKRPRGAEALMEELKELYNEIN